MLLHLRQVSGMFYLKATMFSHIKKIYTLVVLGTFPLIVMFLLAISLAIRILCLGAILFCYKVYLSCNEKINTTCMLVRNKVSIIREGIKVHMV